MSGTGASSQARAAWRLARREARHGLRRVGPYMASIAIGVAALVAIQSFRSDVVRAFQREAEVLMGADARLSGEAAFPPAVASFLDSLAAAGHGVARVTTLSSMVLAPRSDVVRLLQVRALEPGYPFHGAPRTRPQGLWGAHLEPGRVLVDPAVLGQLQVEVGDSLEIGAARVEIAGTVDDLPTDLGYQTAIGPRIHLSHETMEAAGLLGFGSLAEHEAYLRIPDEAEARAVRDRAGERLSEASIRFTLAGEQARRLANGVRFLGRFLGLVGLGALLLGGIGVASAIDVYVREKRAHVAILHCLGARTRTTFSAYLGLAAALGAMGAAAGVALGMGVQRALPRLLEGVLPVSVRATWDAGAALAGLGIGIWVAVIFALVPLLEVRRITPLQALRADIEPAAGRDPARLAAGAALLASVVILCVAEAPETDIGFGFAAGLLVAAGILWLLAGALTRATRRFFPARAPYPVRQGVSNLFRPRNQTRSVTLALGFGAFVVGTLLEVDGSIRHDLTRAFGEGRPNVLFFDVQPDQVEGVLGLLPGPIRAGAEVSPLVPSRIAEINGRTPEELHDRSRRGERPEGWALRREYRNSYRSFVGRAEELVAGRWWDGTPGSEDATAVDTGGLPGVSLEEDVAGSLRVELGDTITWEVSGVPVPTVVTSLRRVEWDRLEPNFFAVLEPGALDGAPQTMIVLARVEDPGARQDVQRALVSAFPNVSALDFSRVQEAIDEVLSAVRRAVGFLGGFSGVAGGLVLAAALATSRHQRRREGALLRTLGARRGQVRAVFLAEYVALGTLATAAGLLLASGAAAVLVPALFEMSWVPGPARLLVVWAGVSGLTVVIGMLASRDAFRGPPLPVLREAGE